MKAKELKEKLNQYPDSMDVFLCGGKTEFTYGLLNTVRKQNIKFSESEDDFNEEICAVVECIVLDEE